MSPSSPNTIGANDVAAEFPQLLTRLESGETFTILKHGSPVARLVPVSPTISEDVRREAIATMRELATRNRLDGLPMKELIEQGRK